jgi:ADP-ribose pyrophosphatase
MTTKTLHHQVEVLTERDVFRQFFFGIVEAHIRHSRYNGEMTTELTRLKFDRGDSAAVLLHDPTADTIILTEQFRYPAYRKGEPETAWLLEIPAGTVEADETFDPTRTMKRELLEEIGYKVNSFKKISTFYVSPGGSSERIHLYYASATPRQKVAPGGGLLSEGEDIRVVAIPTDEALHMIETGRICDAKTIIGLQWLKQNRG